MTPDFKRLQYARIAAIVATQAQGTAVAWDVLQRTHRPLDLGYVGLAQFAPIAGLSLISGHVVDRFDRRRLLDFHVQPGATLRPLPSELP